MEQCDKCGGCGQVQTPLSKVVEELIDKAWDAIEHVSMANYNERVYEAHTWVIKAAHPVRRLIEEMEA